jgi:hypothetical protein
MHIQAGHGEEGHENANENKVDHKHTAILGAFMRDLRMAWAWGVN